MGIKNWFTDVDFTIIGSGIVGLYPVPNRNYSKKLENLLKEVILPNQKFKIDLRWRGIMAMGNSKDPIVSQLSENIYCGVRLGGMSVEIGS